MKLRASTASFRSMARAIVTVTVLGFTVQLNAAIVADAGEPAKAINATTNLENVEQKVEQKKVLSEQWGIELVAMRSTAAGHMVDFRYRVLDAEKAAPLFKRQTKPYLIHQESGKVLAVPNTAKIGSLRNSNTPQNGRIYWMFFGNHHRLVQKGDKVTVAIGDFRASDIVVQ